MIHLIPADDWIEHTIGDDCLCEPDVYFLDPRDGEVLDEPVAIHHSVNGEKPDPVWVPLKGKHHG